MSLRPLPLVLAIWACATTGVVAAGLGYWLFGGGVHIIALLGSSLAVTAGATFGTLRRRRRVVRELSAPPIPPGGASPRA